MGCRDRKRRFFRSATGGGRVSGPDIFLSYARQDRTTARMFAECLSDEGFNVWWDASLHSGETFDEVIERNLRDARAVVVLWSPRSVSSRWVRAEATQADRRNKLVPAIIEPCDRPIIFELTHAAELSDWAGEITDLRWRTFVADLHRMVEAKTGHEHARTSQPAVAKQAQPTSRQPLRPGSDDVIFADRTRRSTPPAPAARRSEPASSGELHRLEFEDAELGEGPIVIDASSLKVGRSAPADIVIAHKSVSREHCSIGLANDELLVTDLNSTNGTYIDEVRINRATILPVGSVLRVGQVALKHSVQADADSNGGSASPGDLRSGRLAAAS